MSFYITLPSNSESTYSNNTTTNYRTILYDQIQLNDEYEVALVEAIYNLSWFLPVGSIIYSYTEEKSTQNFEVIPLIFHDGDTIIKVIEKLNTQIQEHVLIKKYNERFNLFRENEIRSLMNKNNQSYVKVVLDEKKFPKSTYGTENNLNVINNIKSTEREFLHAPMLKYGDESVFIQFTNTFHTLQFTGQICDILKTNEAEIHSSIKNEPSFIKINSNENINKLSIISLVNTLYIYTDIIHYQYVGSQRIPLLRNIVINYNTSQKTTWAHYDNPHYLRVNKTNISSILIDIRDDKGNKILFDSGNISIKLHFRKISKW